MGSITISARNKIALFDTQSIWWSELYVQLSRLRYKQPFDINNNLGQMFCLYRVCTVYSINILPCTKNNGQFLHKICTNLPQQF
jgi:hypothetical protein